MTICKSCLEKSLKDSNKVYRSFARIPYNNYFGKYLKIWYQWFQGRHLSWGCTSANLDAVSQRLFQKNSTTAFFWSLPNFFTIDIKSNFWWVAQKIFSKKVKQLLQRRSGGQTATTEEEWRDKSCNGTVKESKVNHYENFVLIVFRWTGISSCGCYVLKKWLDIRQRFLFLILRFLKREGY